MPSTSLKSLLVHLLNPSRSSLTPGWLINEIPVYQFADDNIGRVTSGCLARNAHQLHASSTRSMTLLLLRPTRKMAPLSPSSMALVPWKALSLTMFLPLVISPSNTRTLLRPPRSLVLRSLSEGKQSRRSLLSPSADARFQVRWYSGSRL